MYIAVLVHDIIPLSVCVQLLMLIGGGMEQFDNVNGVVVSRRRKGDRIALWTKKKSKSSSLRVW